MATMKTVSRRSYGGLKVFEVAGDPALPAVVLLHGYGADGADLVPLAGEVPCRSGFRWLFPEAPLAMGPAGFPAGRMWFAIDEAALVEAQRTGTPLDLSGTDPAELAPSREALEALLRDAALEPGRVVLGGFSQGSMVAVEAALKAASAPAGLVVLSGNLIAGGRWGALAPRRAGLPFFQSHGRADPVLPFKGALALEALLREAGLKGSLAPFDGGHFIAPETLSGLGVFLDSLVR